MATGDRNASIRSGPIVVIGSVNMDLVCKTPHIPVPGQTILGSDFVTIPGGKGANQAVAAARLGGDVHFIGRVGDDDLGRRLLDGLNRNKVAVDHVGVTPGAPSGVAMILVDREGENSIVVAPGANHKLTPADIDAASALLRRASIAVMQLEIPFPTVQHAIALCRKFGVFTILDPAPAPQKLPAGLWSVDILTPNETEARILMGPAAEALDDARIGASFLARGARRAVLKLGARGAMIVCPDLKSMRIGGFRVKVVDTTAAGDAFTGAMAVALAEGLPMPEAVRFANAAGARCCERFGAQPSLPDRASVLSLLRRT